MIVAHNDRGRCYLLELRLGNVAFWGLELVAITTTAAAARLRFGRLHDRYIEIGRDQCDLLPRLLDDLLAKIIRAYQQRRDHDDVGDERKRRTAFFVVVESPNIAYRHRLRSQ